MGNGRHNGLPKGVRNTGAANGYRVYNTYDDIRHATDKDTKRFESTVRGNTDYIHAVKSYTGSGYRDTNPLARDSRYANATTDEMLADLRNRNDVSQSTVRSLEMLHNALNNGNVPEPFVGYRGSGYALLFGDNSSRSFADVKALEGKMVRDMGNMSTSMLKGHEFDGDVFYEVRVPSGSGIGANVMNLSSVGTGEAEFLFNNGSYFIIKHVKKTSEGKPHVVLEYVGRG